jgi:MFS family permease
MALPFFILLPQARGLSLAEIGLVFGLHSAVAIVLEVPSGGLADAIGRRTTLLAGGVLTVVALGVYAVATVLAAYLLAAAALAAGRALMSGALEAWFVDELHRVEPEASLRAPLAAGSTAEGIGSGAGAAVGGFLPLLPLGLPDAGGATLVQLSLPLVAAALAALAYVVALLWLVAEPPRRRAAGWTAGARDTLALTREGIGVARRSRNVRLLLGVILGLGLVMSTTEVLWPRRLNDLVAGAAADSAPLFGLLAAASMAAFSAGSALSARIARRAGRRRTFAGAYVVLGAMLVLLGTVSAAVPFCAAFLVYFSAIGVADPLHYETLHDAVAGSTRATVVSADGLTSQIGGLGGNLLLVPLAGAAGIGVAWGAAALIAVGAAALAGATRAAPAPATPPPRPAAPSGAA